LLRLPEFTSETITPLAGIVSRAQSASCSC